MCRSAMSRARAICWGPRRACAGQLGRDEVLSALRPILADPSILKIGQNLKYDLKVLARHDTPVTPIDDTMLMSYALDSGMGGHGMDELAERHLGPQADPDQGTASARASPRSPSTESRSTRPPPTPPRTRT